MTDKRMTEMTDTIINVIRARTDEPGYTLDDYAWTLAEYGSAKEANLLAELLDDRATLLAILDEVAELPDKWELAECDEFEKILDGDDCAKELRAKLERK
jgi:hypothetical protein